MCDHDYDPQFALPNGAVLLEQSLRSVRSPHMVVVWAYVEGAVQPWVTWLYSTETGGCVWGHYFSDREASARDYRERVAYEMRNEPGSLDNSGS